MTTYKYTNKLINETSPYLLQHAHNPVDWHPWGEEALNKARRENKMIFLSIGYSSCHWCHVMEKESFENEEVAEYLNQHFIPIKVDREERPDLDTIYMEAVQLMTGQGGWPLNVWLTPDHIPIYGGTYFPPDGAYNRPGFLMILHRLVDLYENEPDQIYERVNYLREALKADLYDHLDDSDLSDTLLDKAYNIYKQSYDINEGGFSGAPKFPASMAVEFLFRYYHINDNTDAKNMAVNTLRKMIMGGIFDQLGGGIHRYSTDAIWLVPHFEKMLYDNGLLLSALSDGYQVTKDALFEDAIRKTIEFIKHEMTSPEGGFFAALDADSEGEEGKYYVWSYDEIKNHLNENEFKVFTHYYNVAPTGNWEGENILNRIHRPRTIAKELNIPLSKFQQLLISASRKMLEVRSNRVAPARDDKIITSWNAIVLKGLCKAYKCLGDDSWKHLAVKNAQFIIEYLSDKEQLYRTFNRGEARHKAFLDDHALFGEALTYLFEITGDDKYLRKAIDQAQYIREHFYDASKAAFSYISENHEQLISKPRETFDNATPSGTSATIMLFQRIAHLSGDMDYLQIAEHALKKLARTATDHATPFGYYLQALCYHLHPGYEIILVGPVSQRRKFEDYLSDIYNPLSFIISGNDFRQSDFAATQGKTMINNCVTTYVCKDFSCRKPVTDIKELKQLLFGLSNK
jgi:uncharacterized protein YyaL (SSP411 family)